jgi:hypothetical protein
MAPKSSQKPREFVRIGHVAGGLISATLMCAAATGCTRDAVGPVAVAAVGPAFSSQASPATCPTSPDFVVVTTETDLRNAVLTAPAGSTIAINGMIALSGGPILIIRSDLRLTCAAAGAGLEVQPGSTTQRLIRIEAPRVSITGLRLDGHLITFENSSTMVVRSVGQIAEDVTLADNDITCGTSPCVTLNGTPRAMIARNRMVPAAGSGNNYTFYAQSQTQYLPTVAEGVTLADNDMTCGAYACALFIGTPHLFRNTSFAGVFLTNKWFVANAEPPTGATLARLPIVTRDAGMEIIHAMREHGAVRVAAVPRAPYFAGKVYLLINSASGSASEPLAHHLRATGRATLIGQRTGGRMLTALPHGLGDGWVLVVPEADFYAFDGTRLDGRGVTPHIEVPPDEAVVAAGREIGKINAYAGAVVRSLALAGVGRWQDAVDAYREAAALSPDASTLRASLERAIRRRLDVAPTDPYALAGCAPRSRSIASLRSRNRGSSSSCSSSAGEMSPSPRKRCGRPRHPRLASCSAPLPRAWTAVKSDAATSPTPSCLSGLRRTDSSPCISAGGSAATMPDFALPSIP